MADLEARRRHMDLVSKKMGDLLLKGYKMLGSSCDDCSNVLLQDRSGSLICISCDEMKKNAPVEQAPPADGPELAGVAPPEPFAGGIQDQNAEIRSMVKTTFKAKLKWALDRLETTDDVMQCAPVLDLVERLLSLLNALG